MRPTGEFEVRNVMVGRHRVEVRLWGDARGFDAGEVTVGALRTDGVVLTPVAR